MPDLDAAIRAYDAILSDAFLSGMTPDRQADLNRAHHDVLVARHVDGGCAFCITAETSPRRAMADRRTKGGYESGDTPASELAVPEVLFRPGAGAADPLAARDAEIALLVEESARWKDLYETYCKPEDVRALEDQRDEAIRRADEAEEQLNTLYGEYARLHVMFKERSDWAQRVWLAWCSARERARRKGGDD